MEVFVNSSLIQQTHGPNNILLRVLRELTDVIGWLFSIILEKSCSLGDTPDDWKKAYVTPIFEKDLKEYPKH